MFSCLCTVCLHINLMLIVYHIILLTEFYFVFSGVLIWLMCVYRKPFKWVIFWNYTKLKLIAIIPIHNLFLSPRPAKSYEFAEQLSIPTVCLCQE